jgi:D-xylose transport system substrate-binding protein
MIRIRKPVALAATVVAVTSLTLAGCSSSTTSSDSSSGPSGEVPQIDAKALTSDFAAMGQLKDVAAQGQGLIGVLLPDTTSSTRYVQYDAPYLKQAFEAAGLSADQFKIENAQGSASKMQSQAEAMINSGASVLLVDPLDPGSGAAIEQSALKAGVQVIDYDRLVTGGPKNRYYVSFDNVEVGKLIGQGFVECATKWKVDKPNVLIMNGDPKDNNAKLFNEGYMGVLQPKIDDGSYVKAGEPAGTWDPQTAATTFEQQYTDNSKINSAVTPNDDNANAVISVLQKNNIKANTFPTTGQDASLPGLQNVLKGFQCGTVYKPIYLEAQAAAALALYLRAGLTPPATLVNSKTKDTEIGADIPSAYTTPIWVTTDNMADTVVKDGAVKATDLCAGNVQQACTDAGIS